MLHHASDHVLCQFPAGNSYQFGRVGSRCAYGVTTSKYGWYAMSRDAFLSGVGTFFTSRNVFRLSYVRPTRLRLYTRHVTWHTLALFFTSFGSTFVLVTAARSTPTRTQRTGSARSRTLPAAREEQKTYKKDAKGPSLGAPARVGRVTGSRRRSRTHAPVSTPMPAEGSQRGQPLRQPREQGWLLPPRTVEVRSELSQNDRVVATRLQTTETLCACIGQQQQLQRLILEFLPRHRTWWWLRQLIALFPWRAAHLTSAWIPMAGRVQR